MLYLLLAVFGSATISIIMRLSSQRVSARLSMLAANYLMCLTLGAAFSGFRVAPDTASTCLMGLFNGILYLSSFILLQYTTRKAGVVLSSVFMKLGLLVPFILSVTLFKEAPTWLHICGFILAVAAIVLMHLEKGAAQKVPLASLLALLILGGSANAMSKVFNTWGNTAFSEQFLFYTFTSAFLLCLILVLTKREKPKAADLLFGLLIGIPNFFSSRFLLASLGSLPAVVAYPTFSAGTILLVTLAGILFFKERLSKPQWLAMGGIFVALILLNM